MQFKLLFTTALLSTASLVAGQSSTVTSVSPAQVCPPSPHNLKPPRPLLTPFPNQSSKIVKDLVNYLTSVAAQPAATSVNQILQTAMPSDVQALYATNPGQYFSQAVTQTAPQSWFTALPSDVQSYLNSIGSAEASIIASDLKAAAPTHGAMKVAGAALAVGAAGLAML